MKTLSVTLLLLLLFVVPASGGGSSSCAIEGDPIHWIADFCMSQLQTDDEIAAMDCIGEELRREFPDECTAKRHYKRALCEAAVSDQAVTGTIESCLADAGFMGSTVRNGGVGD